VTDIRLSVYDYILETGRVPLVAELAERTSLSREDVGRELRRLQEIHAFALAPASDEILMAHPFSSVPTAHVVRAAERSFWANCAWDALAIPSMLAVDATIETRCGDCGEMMIAGVSGGRPESQDAVVHFVVPPRHFWRNVGFT
jgi:hypothetical protein